MKKYARRCGGTIKNTSRNEVIAKMRDAHSTYTARNQEEAAEVRPIL